MSILDNEGHDPQGFGNTPSRTMPLQEFQAVVSDNERLRAALDKIAHMEPSEIAPETFPGLVHGAALLFANSQRIAREALRPNQQGTREK